MPLAPLATTAQLATYMNVDEASLPASASLFLDIASALARKWTGQRITRTSSTVTLYPEGCRVSLPQRPVVSVESVTDVSGVAPVPLAADAWILRRDVLHVRAYAVDVAYTHGYSEVPADVMGVILGAVSRALSNPENLRQETVGAVSRTYAAETIGANMSPADRDILADYRRRAAW